MRNPFSNSRGLGPWIGVPKHKGRSLSYSYLGAMDLSPTGRLELFFCICTIKRARLPGQLYGTKGPGTCVPVQILHQPAAVHGCSCQPNQSPLTWSRRSVGTSLRRHGEEMPWPPLNASAEQLAARAPVLKLPRHHLLVVLLASPRGLGGRTVAELDLCW